MSGQRFINMIRTAIDETEDPDDVVAMIDILAAARSESRDSNIQKEYRAAGKILCVIFDVLKPLGYREQISAVRRAFAGISLDYDVRESYERSLTSVVRTSGLSEVFVTPISELFNVEPDKEPEPERQKARA